MPAEISQSKTICILAIVAGCFAVLWPSLFYPMLKGSFAPHTQTGCCNVVSNTDENIVKIVMEICDHVIETTNKKTKLEKCRLEILNTCAINITDIISGDKVNDISYNKHVINEIRSLNGSLCLKYHYGVSLTSLGVMHRLKNKDNPLMNNIPQERTPVHLRASMHPALMEKGRAIPQPHIGSRQATPGSFKQPIPGYRPPMGGMGGTGQKTRGGAMNILMPMYTIGIVLFFVYTMMKLLSKKDNVEEKNTNGAFSSRYDCSGIDSSSKLQSLIPPTQLGCIEKDTIVNAFSSLLEDVNREILSSINENEKVPTIFEDEEFKNDETDEKKFQENTISNHSDNDIDDNTNTKIFTQLEESASIESSKPKETCNTGEEETTDLEISNKKVIQVVNMETSESVGGGHCWTQIEKEKISSKDKMVSSSPIEKPISLIIPGTIPKNSQVLISDGPHNTSSETEDHEAIISSKVTLSLIPDDRVEEYLTSDEAEGDNIISTQSDTK
ncbi:Hypothetical protein CINCED_3A018757 [Cinara cedri]|uniref:Resistance to inhibitors of cholinesterase protein 3 N-terminal domain-containing protein n=1 Tax=Cinara cedri TaxID=506608 RepID=A0A5E4NGX4_9HEMI|nr:Hypothetical protein CINCED_3A018757 [Cinara cedri]